MIALIRRWLNRIRYRNTPSMNARLLGLHVCGATPHRRLGR